MDFFLNSQVFYIPNDIYIIIAMVLPIIMKISLVDINHYIVKQILIIYHSLKQFSAFMVLQKLRIKIEENEKLCTNFKKCTLMAENKVL